MRFWISDFVFLIGQFGDKTLFVLFQPLCL